MTRRRGGSGAQSRLLKGWLIRIVFTYFFSMSEGQVKAAAMGPPVDTLSTSSCDQDEIPSPP